MIETLLAEYTNFCKNENRLDFLGRMSVSDLDCKFFFEDEKFAYAEEIRMITALHTASDKSLAIATEFCETLLLSNKAAREAIDAQDSTKLKFVRKSLWLEINQIYVAVMGAAYMTSGAYSHLGELPFAEYRKQNRKFFSNVELEKFEEIIDNLLRRN